MSSDPSLSLAYASTILACISFVLVIAVYVIYWKGPVLRKRSPFAQQLSDAKAAHNEVVHEKGTHIGEGSTAVDGTHLSRMPTGARARSFARSQQDLRVRQNTGSRPQSTHEKSNPNSRANSRANSPVRREVAEANHAAVIREAMNHERNDLNEKSMV